MANLLHVYRRFYHVENSASGSSSYTLIPPYSLSASVRNISQGSIVVEASATTVNTTVGVYYADLSVSLYNTDDIYEIDWQVEYTVSSPVRHLFTRFQFPGVSVSVPAGNVVRELDIEVVANATIDAMIERSTLEYNIEPHNP